MSLDSDIEQLISAGIARSVLDSEMMENHLLSNFKFSLGRLDWSKAKVLKQLAAPSSRVEVGANVEGGLDIEEYARNVITEFFRSSLVKKEWVYAVFDMEIDTIAFRTKDAEQVFAALSQTPCHRYILPKDASWCFQWSLEDDLVFGKPNPT